MDWKVELKYGTTAEISYIASCSIYYHGKVQAIILSFNM